MKRKKNSNMVLTLNGQPEPLNLQLQNAMFYPNAYLNFNGNGEYTKHYYSGSERIASRLGNANMDITVTANARLTSRSTQLASRFQDDIRELMSDNSTVCPPSGIPVNSLHQTGTSDIYYYHTNHLGSTAFVTDQNRNVTQGFLYAPFGEITTEYNANFGNDIIPKYSFNAKELDEETGMYYYEARYYKPPVFTSRDPMFEKYFWMTPYAYCANNPVKYVDPSGSEVGIPPSWIRTAWLGLKYPNIASAIGPCRPGEMNTNISTRSERFATRGISSSTTNTILKNNGCEKDIDPCSEIGAFRHTLWQATITSYYGRDIATEVGNAHEENPYADLTARTFSSMEEADQVVDLLNNILGRTVGEQNPNCQMNKLAGEVLELFYTNGLYTGKLNDDGTWSVSRTTITEEQYDNYKSVLNGLDFNGFNSTEQVNYRAKCERVNQAILDAGKWMDNK